ncbi:MAG: PucR family transcriptional regulator ligand-binding domain-containing protein [Actinobacteria bacterium]|nr:PucR family transcriptional regulator ligand-binding domain-containing protein [Actinomycetota bacterium]
MRGLSLDEILEIESLKDSKILAGEDQLDRLVTGVTVGEVPDIANWLTGGELVLSTFFAVSRDPDTVGAFAKKIIGGPAAALAIKPARFLESMPPDVLELARKLQFPVIEVPSETRWTRIISDVYSAMARRDIAEAAGDFGNELLRGAIDGRGLKAIASSTSKRLDAPIIIFDWLDGVVAEAPATSPFPRELVAFLEVEVRHESAESIFDGSSQTTGHRTVAGHDLLVAPVTIGMEIVGVVATVAPDLDERSLGLLKKSAEASAVEIARQRAIEEAQARVYGDFLEDLIAGRIPLEQVDSRVARLGGDVTRGYAVLYTALEPERLFGRFYREVARVIKSGSKNSLVMEHEGSLVVILSAEDERAANRSKYAREGAERILVVARALEGQATVGVSRWQVDSGEIIRSLDEAKIALESGRRLNGAGSVTDFDQVGIYRLLLPLARDGREDGRGYYEETVGRIVSYDERHGTDLLPTLESFRRNNENVALAAEELYAHRHTVRYRLQRIGEITGCDPFKGTEREKLYMGLYVKYLLKL